MTSSVRSARRMPSRKTGSLERLRGRADRRVAVVDTGIRTRQSQQLENPRAELSAVAEWSWSRTCVMRSPPWLRRTVTTLPALDWSCSMATSTMLEQILKLPWDEIGLLLALMVSRAALSSNNSDVVSWPERRIRPRVVGISVASVFNHPEVGLEIVKHLHSLR